MESGEIIFKIAQGNALRISGSGTSKLVVEGEITEEWKQQVQGN